MKRKRRKIFSIILPCLLLLTAVQNGAADEDSLATFLFIEYKPSYLEGDIVNITVHVLDKGEYLANPDNVSLTVNSTKQIPLTNIGTGIYIGTYELNSTDAEYSLFLHFQTNASYGLNSD
ncbi:MAG: hypothetical protein JSV09_01220, partial [Thermoplasmata archaeon]